MKTTKRSFRKRLLTALAAPLLASLLATQCSAVDHFLGVNFAGGTANGAPTSLLPTDSAGVVPQVGWNNFGGQSATKGATFDEAGNLTDIKLSFSTGELYGTGTYNVGFDFTNGNAKLLNGYINSLDPTNSPTGTNIVTFTNLTFMGFESAWRRWW